MGSRYEDQPPELWAGPESLDPTPVWKQFALVGLLLGASLLLIAGVAVIAFAAELATPPALVPGDRLVLARDAVPGEGAAPARVGEPVIADERAILISRPSEGEYVAVSAWWTHPETGARCAIEASGAATFVAAAPCRATFGARGEPLEAPRGLDRYLVSVSEDRVIVNLARTIRGFGSTPQPRVSPLPESTPTPTRRR